MAKIFLDTNKLIDVIENRDPGVARSLEGYEAHISTLSIHVLCYVYNKKMPDEVIIRRVKKFVVANFSEEILSKALLGPTTDLEDNVQLHSAAEGGCDIFLTNDKKLLKMKFFGMVRIEESL